jgi:glycine cleavage system H lipoate-binding protein
MDFLPTKGIEYLYVIAYLLVLVPFFLWMLRGSAERVERPVARAARALALPVSVPMTSPMTFSRGWFVVPQGYHFHRGHSWALPDEGNVVRVGVDDFAQRLVGEPDALLLPREGERVEQGRPGWELQVEGRAFDMLSPVAGEVIEVNREVVHDPTLVSRDPYGRGWLFKVRVPREKPTFENLLPAELAQAWMDRALASLTNQFGPQLGTVLQDGGLPVRGFARQLAPDRWHRLAAEHLLTA